MNKIYLLIITRFEDERNSIVLICSNEETAQCKKLEYENNWKRISDPHKYYIKEIDLDSSKDILFDAVKEEDYYYEHDSNS